MDFTDCELLREVSDLSRIPNLVTLILDGCKNLVTVHHSVGFLDKLVHLSLRRCYNLRSFVGSLKLRSLKYLILYGCSRLQNFPEIECQMKCLEHINLQDTGIKELPSSIRYLFGIEILDLRGCTNLKNLPDSICQLQHLKVLCLHCCTGIKELPSSIGDLGRIERLDLDGCTNLMNLPDSIYQLQHLKILNLNKCEQLGEILRLPPNVVQVNANGCISLAIFLEKTKSVLTEANLSTRHECPFNLEDLDLSSSAIVSLPAWFNKFVGLKHLSLEDCKQLREIPELPPKIQVVYAHGCMSLERFRFNSIYDLPMLRWIDVSDCPKLVRNDVQIHLLIEVSLSLSLSLSLSIDIYFCKNLS
jgi:Leucine-rich repeat (LRR) protein